METPDKTSAFTLPGITWDQGAEMAPHGVGAEIGQSWAMVHSLATPEGRKAYALRKQTPEAEFGIIKAVMGFRKLSARPRHYAQDGKAIEDFKKAFPPHWQRCGPPCRPEPT